MISFGWFLPLGPWAPVVRVLFLITLASRVPGLAAQEGRALTLMEAAGSHYQEIDGFCADFQQELEVPLLSETTVSSGSLCQEQPDLFAMRFTDPAGDALVADGEFFWVYYPSSDPGQVLQFSLEQRPGGVDFNREFLEAPGEKYDLAFLGEEVVEGRSTYLISATPKGDPGFEEARLWLEVDRSLIRKVRIGMKNGSVRTLTLRNIRLDPPPDTERFRFTPPPGAQVIRRSP